MKSDLKYEIIYWSEEDQAYIAEVPELPGCAADGKTYKQALANLEVIVALLSNILKGTLSIKETASQGLHS